MIKKNLKILIITSAVILLPILAGVILWDRLPNQIPSHWNMAGEIDGFSSKPFAVFGMPLILLTLHWVCVFATLTDPKKKNHSDKILHFVFWLIPILSIALLSLTYFVAMGNEVSVQVLVPLIVGLLFVAVGNYLPKCRQNYTIGIKIPFTLCSEENWNKTHRTAGWIWVFGGIIIMAAGLFNIFWLIIPVALIMVFLPLIYSYILHRKGI